MLKGSSLLLAALGSFLPAHALPLMANASATDDDATIVLSLYQDSFLGDSVNFCSLELTITNDSVGFTSGDSFTVSVEEAEDVGDRIIFQAADEVTAQEVSAGRVERSFDCGQPFPSDMDGTLEIFATAQVTKGDCGFSCVNDRPATTPLTVTEVGDDDLEENDSQGMAAAISAGLLADRVVADEDWYEFSVASQSRVLVQFDYVPTEGRIDAELFSGMLSQGTVMDDTAGGVLDAGILAPGTYTLRVSERSAGNSVFYDLELTISSELVFADGFEDSP